jgi:hypothetical protein
MVNKDDVVEFGYSVWDKVLDVGDWITDHLYWSYYKAHMLYFLVVTLIGGCIIFGTEHDHGIQFIDAYFTSVSAVCLFSFSF